MGRNILKRVFVEDHAEWELVPPNLHEVLTNYGHTFEEDRTAADDLTELTGYDIVTVGTSTGGSMSALEIPSLRQTKR